MDKDIRQRIMVFRNLLKQGRTPLHWAVINVREDHEDDIVSDNQVSKIYRHF